MEKIYNFYDKLFLYYYNLKKNSDDTPQYLPIIIISTVQSLNIFFFVILVYYFFRIDFSFLPKWFLIINIGVTILNFYQYQIKNRTEKIVRRKLEISLRFKIFSYFYFALSFISPLFFIYLINEYLS